MCSTPNLKLGNLCINNYIGLQYEVVDQDRQPQESLYSERGVVIVVIKRVEVKVKIIARAL